ncbi:MAG: hypothetical protein N3F08_04840 [Crenarchaeota archaeon]|nr:hypothetical protein [Thermoproteota archaeon]
MSRRVALILALALLLTFLSTSLKSYSSPFKLYYDDNVEYDWSDFYPSGVTIRFFPLPSWRIKLVRFHEPCFLRSLASVSYFQRLDKNLNIKYWSPYLFNMVFRKAMLYQYTMQLSNANIVPMLTVDGTRFWISDEEQSTANNSFTVDANNNIILNYMNAIRKPLRVYSFYEG